jgi:hypothetical protein
MEVAPVAQAKQKRRTRDPECPDFHWDTKDLNVIYFQHRGEQRFCHLLIK